MANYKISLITGEKQLEIREQELKQPKTNQVLLKIEASAICTLEQRLYRGVLKNYPFAGGHEAAGSIVSVGENVAYLKEGDRAAIRLLTNCGECYYCRSGLENQCEVSFRAMTHEGVNGPGGLSEYMLVDSRAVFKLDPNVNIHHAALAEPLACCIHSVRNGVIELGDDVVVLGVGVMGALHIALAKMQGARVIACEVDTARLEVARAMGADITINSKELNAVEKVKELTEGRGANVTFCTAALSALAADAIKMTAKRGRVVLYSSFHPNDPVSLDPNALHYSEMILTGSVNPGIKDFQTAIRLLSLGLIKIDKMISASYPLDKINEAFEKAILPGTYRVLIDF